MVRGKIDVAIGPHPLLGFWYRGNDTGVNFGLRTGTVHDIHMSIFVRDDAIICEVSDYPDGLGVLETKKKIWQSKPRPFHEIKDKVSHLEDDFIVDYDTGDEYEELDETWVRYIGAFNSKAKKVAIDVLPLLQSVASETLLKKRKIANGLGPGILRKDDSMELIVPIDDEQMFRLDMDINNPMFNFIPVPETLQRYMDHVDKSRILEEFILKNIESKKDEIQSAILSVLSKNESPGFTSPSPPPTQNG